MSKEVFFDLSPIVILSIGNSIGINPSKHLVDPKDKTSFSYETYRLEVWQKMLDGKNFDYFKKL